jgi:hypothetical protein
MTRTDPLREITKNVWVAEGEARFWGAGLETRMTVLRLRDGGLFVHSPICLTPELKAALESVGPVRFVVAPNKYHHLFVGDYPAAFPDARLYAAPGLDRKRPDLTFHETLTDRAPAEWAEEIDPLVFWALPIFNEVVFLHRPSRTLVTTDLVFNFREIESRLLRLAMRLNGAYGRFGPSRLVRLLTRDRASARESIQQILDWEFDRVVMAHGEIVETEGRKALRGAFAWL